MTARPNDDRIALEQIRTFFAHAQGNVVSILFGGSMVALVLLSGGTPVGTIGLWAIPFTLCSLVLIAFEHQVQRQGIHLHNCRRQARIRVALGGVVMLFYGGAGFLLPAESPPLTDAMLFIVLSTVVTVGSLSFAVLPAHYVTVNISCLQPLMLHFIARYISHREPIYLMLLLIAVVWQVVVLRKTRVVSATSIGAIALTQNLQDEVAEHKRTKEAMQQMALHDALTGLGNRRYLDDTLRRSIGNAQRDPAHFGLLVIDLDKFKPVNDIHGHAVGDALLQSVAQRLRGCIRTGDFCARLGGDEFAIVIHGLNDAQSINAFADKVRAALQAPHQLGEVEAQSTGSVGWAVFPEDGADMARLLSVADQRMYTDKQRRTQAAVPA
jgi:diguanylate cyclase (GGDEF)-like protein